jgi:ribosome-binding factor A
MKFVPEIQFLKRNVISHVGQIDELLEIVHEKSKKKQ